MIEYLEFARILLIFGILAINTITDIQKRVYFGDDRLYVVLGAVGFCLFLADSVDSLLISLFMLAINVTIVLLLWRFKVAASGDIIILLVFAITLPTTSNIVLLPAIVIFTAMITLAIFGILYNVILNLSTMYKKEPLFERYDASILKKICSFGIAHQRRVWEKYTISIENEKGGFSLFAQPFGKKFCRKKALVVSALPLVPFLLVTFTLVLFLLN